MPITSLDVLSVGKVWPPACEVARMKKYANGRALLSGEHSEVFTDIVRLIQRDRRRTQTYIALAHPRRIAKAFGDMVFGEQPTIKAKGIGEVEPVHEEGAAEVESIAQEQVEAYVAEMDLFHEGYQSLIDIQSLGDGVLKVTLKDKGVAGLYPDITATDPCIWYPVVSAGDRQDVVAHILAWTWDSKVDGKTVRKLKAETHEPGFVTTYVGTVRGGKIETLIEDPETPPISTGVDECLVVAMHNFRSSADTTGVSDFDDLEPILQEMEVRLYLIASILDKHSDPKLYGPRSLVSINALTGESEVAQTDFVPLEGNETPPGYVTWEGQLTAAYHELDFLAEQALFVMEATPAMFGNITGTVTSGAALKRLLIAPLMKASRLRNRLDIGLTKALTLASLLHATVPGSGAVVFSDVSIEWKDGLPEDPMETATIHALLVTSKIESAEDAVRAVFSVEGDELKERMDRLAASAPPALPANPIGPRLTLSPQAFGQQDQAPPGQPPLAG